MKDPVCGMDVSAEGAKYCLSYGNETYYFCSEQCKDSYAGGVGISKPPRKKGVWGRFLERLAKGNNRSYGGTPPKCH